MTAASLFWQEALGGPCSCQLFDHFRRHSASLTPLLPLQHRTCAGRHINRPAGPPWILAKTTRRPTSATTLSTSADSEPPQCIMYWTRHVREDEEGRRRTKERRISPRSTAGTCLAAVMSWKIIVNTSSRHYATNAGWTGPWQRSQRASLCQRRPPFCRFC